MKISYHAINNMPGISRHNIQISCCIFSFDNITAVRKQARILCVLKIEGTKRRLRACCIAIKRTLKRTNRCCTNSDNLMTCSFCGVYGINNILWHVIALGMHNMLGWIIFFDQSKGINTNLKLNRFPLHAFLLNTFNKLWCKMQTCSWRSGRMLFLHGIYRLIFFGVAFVIGNIWRQRNMTCLMYCLV